MNQTNVLRSLKAQLIDNPHRFGPTDSVEHWQSIGSPHSWVVAQEFEDITLLDDVGYGWMALVVGDKVVYVGKDFVCFPERGVVGLDGSYYGVGDKSKLFIEVERRK